MAGLQKRIPKIDVAAGGVRGRGGRGAPPRFQDPEDIQFIKALKGHERQVTALLIDAANNQARSPSLPLAVHWSLPYVC